MGRNNQSQSRLLLRNLWTMPDGQVINRNFLNSLNHVKTLTIQTTNIFESLKITFCLSSSSFNANSCFFLQTRCFAHSSFSSRHSLSFFRFFFTIFHLTLHNSSLVRSTCAPKSVRLDCSLRGTYVRIHILQNNVDSLSQQQRPAAPLSHSSIIHFNEF